MDMNNIQVKSSIEQEVEQHNQTYKSGTVIDKRLAKKIDEYCNTINCFQCLDTKQSWYFRGEEYKNDGKGEYYVNTCTACTNKDEWIKDSLTNEVYGIYRIKLFNKLNNSGAERFCEIEKVVNILYPQVEEPIYNKSDKQIIEIKKKIYNLQIEVGNIMSQCEKIFKSYCGDVLSLSSILSSISLNISNCENDNKQEQILCEEIEKTKFIYVKITNNSSSKKKSILGLYEYNKYNLDICIYISLLKPVNETAYEECSNIISKLGTNEIHEVKKLFSIIDLE